MDCKKLKDPSIRLKSSVPSSVRLGQPDRKASQSCPGLSSSADNTSPIMCAVCGSKDYITLHSHDKNSYPFGPTLGWNSPDFFKKNISMEFPNTCGSVSQLAQPIFPHISLFHFPSNFYYNSRIPCESNEKYFGHNLEVNGSKATTVNSESTLYRERERTKSATKVARDSTFRKEEPVNFSYKKEDSRPASAFTNVSEVRNYPITLNPWMGNFYPFLPYPWAFPFNQPVIPIYLPVPGKWQGVGNENDRPPSNSPMGDSSSVQNEAEKKSDRKDENNTSEYDFEVFARELMLEQKSNFDEDEVDIEVNLDEIANSLKTAGVNSGREINSEKFFNSKEKLGDQPKDNCQEKGEMQNWRILSEVNMQDCCVRTLSNENIWFEAQEDDKKTWDAGQECNWKENGFNRSKQNVKGGGGGDEEKIGDGFHEANPVWMQDRCKTEQEDPKPRLYWKRDSKRSKVSLGESQEINNDRNEWSTLPQTEMNDEIEMVFSDDKISSFKDNSRLRDLHIINDQGSKLDVQYDFVEEPENTLQTSNRETTRQREDNYLVQFNTIGIEYSLRGSEEIKDQRREDIHMANKEFQKKENKNENINFNWDKINEILEEYNDKFTEVGLVLKDKQVFGAKMAKAYSILNNRKQKNPNLTISDSSVSRTDKSENAHGDRKNENKSTGLAQPSSPTSQSVTNKIKKDEKSRSFGFTSGRCDSLKIPVSSSRKSKRQEDTKKRWLS